MSSEYDPAFGAGPPDGAARDDLAGVQAAFRRASRPYLSSPLPWFAWAALLPGAALATGRVAAAGGVPAVLALWSLTVLAGGLVEGTVLLSARRRLGSSALGAWAMRVQGNLSLVGAALSIALLAAGREALLPALWLLLLGHSLFALGGLALGAQRLAGIVYQVGGVAALVPGVPPLIAFALATAAGNLVVAFGVLRARA
ncbi:MAG: hypothetical protein H6Q03_1575 [Acidobacteria bacterium]|nr:hypothetical protein [Acidobacteriota bacterium]